jgi:hypothetical protein
MPRAKETTGGPALSARRAAALLSHDGDNHAKRAPAVFLLRLGLRQLTFRPSPPSSPFRPSTFNHQRNKSLRVARFAGFAISTAFLDGPALGATPEGARTSPAAGAAPITA